MGKEREACKDIIGLVEDIRRGDKNYPLALPLYVHNVLSSIEYRARKGAAKYRVDAMASPHNTVHPTGTIQEGEQLYDNLEEAQYDMEHGGMHAYEKGYEPWLLFITEVI